MTINLKMPDPLSELKPRITVFGVGGAGGNAVNNMIQAGLEGVEFVVANTDAQALAMSSADQRIQMGTAITEGLGAGSQPQIGAAAAEEAMAEILDYVNGSHMVFITAGMGGGTGTGAAPVVARLAREQDILTIGVVTKPFQFEGARRMQIAERGIEELSKHVDTLIVIPNQNLFRVANERTTFADAFAMADQVLYSGVAGITDLMVKEGLINLDFADVRTIMYGMGKAMMGTGEACGEKRAIEAAEAAINNPLLDDVSMKGARGLLISITGGEDLTLYEVDEAATRIRSEVDPEANIILGATFDNALEGYIRVSVVATGIDCADAAQTGPLMRSTADARASSASTFGKLEQRARPETIRTEPAAPVFEETYAAEEESEAAYEEFESESQPGYEPAPAPIATARDDEVTVRRVDNRDPLARRPAPAAQPRPAERPAATVDPSRPFIPPKAAEAAPRMPRVEDFPQHGQEVYTRGKEPPAHHGVEVQKRKAGFLERLASVGLGRREPEPDPADYAEPHFAESVPQGDRAPRAPAGDGHPLRRAEASHAGQLVRPAESGRQQSLTIEGGEDDELEIPAFLRRQAN